MMLLNRLIHSLRRRKGGAEEGDRAHRSSATHARDSFAGGAPCPVCDQWSDLHDRLDFNKSCEEARGKYLPRSGVTVDYCLCRNCGFCFAPEFNAWDQKAFESRIYNEGYVEVDPDYVDVRPRANAATLISLLGSQAAGIRHLDYGGGSGLLSSVLTAANWSSVSYDPFSDSSARLDRLGRFDLITAFEVFEHVPHVNALTGQLASLLVEPGLVLFSTLLSDGHVEAGEPLNWWYAAPRNGHVSLFSRRSLALLADRHGFGFGSLSDNFHAYWKQVPPWAGELFRVQT